MSRFDHSSFRGSRLLAIGAIAAASIGLGCSDSYSISEPSTELTLDTQLRQTIGFWGTVPILPVDAQNPALVELGRSLFFDKILSGNRDISCATCHDPETHVGDGLSLPVGTGGSGIGLARTPGAGRQFVPRNAPSLLNQGLGLSYLFWDGRINEERGFGQIKTPNGVTLPSGLNNLLAAQAMLPVLNRAEMRGNVGDRDVAGEPNELGQMSDAAAVEIWNATMTRVLAIREYQAKFAAAYPTTPASALGFQHAANALSAFQIGAFTRSRSPFDRFLAGENRAMSADEKRGGLLFFGRARCSNCHTGPLLGGFGFANIGVPQIGPGVGTAAPLDLGRGENEPQYKFAFRVQPLRNVELTAPYMHNGAYPTLEAVVRHYSNADSAQRNFDVAQVAPALRGMHHGDAATIKAVLDLLDFRIREPLRFTDDEQRQLVAFLKALTDPAARDLRSIAPSSVPSGLSVR